MNEQRPGQEIVVGLDDSRSARTAVSWAADYARAVGLRLRAVHVFSEERSAMGRTPGVPGLAWTWVDARALRRPPRGCAWSSGKCIPIPTGRWSSRMVPSVRCWSNGPKRRRRSFWAPATMSGSTGCWSARSVTTA